MGLSSAMTAAQKGKAKDTNRTSTTQLRWCNSKATMFASPNPPDFSYTLKPPNWHYRAHGKNPLFIIRQARGAKNQSPQKPLKSTHICHLLLGHVTHSHKKQRAQDQSSRHTLEVLHKLLLRGTKRNKQENFALGIRRVGAHGRPAVVKTQAS